MVIHTKNHIIYYLIAFKKLSNRKEDDTPLTVNAVIFVPIIFMKKFDITTFLFSVVATIIAFVAGEALIYTQMPNILLVGLYFVITGISVVSITCFCVYKVSKLKFEIPVKDIFLKSMNTLVLITIMSTMTMGSLFEFLYEKSFSKNKVTNNYIVLIDNSGSMEVNDSQYERFNALNELFDSIKQNQKMGVYIFNDVCTNILPLQSIDKNNLNNYQSVLDSYKFSENGTDLMLALENIYDNIQNIGSSSLIVISDGECDINDITINKFINADIPIHTIGVADAYSSLHDVSVKTGGTYYDIKDTKTLKQTFSTIYNLENNNILLTKRTGKTKNSTLYMLMRITFITILAFIIKIMQLFVVDIKDLRTSIIVQCVLFSIAAGVSLEFLMQYTNLDERVIRFIMVAFISLIFVQYSNKIIDDQKYKMINSRLVGNKSNLMDDKRNALK